MPVKNNKTSIAVGAGLAIILTVLWYTFAEGPEQRVLEGGEVYATVHPADSSAARLASDDDQDAAAPLLTDPPPLTSSRRTQAPSAGGVAPAVVCRLHGTLIVFGGGQLIGFPTKHTSEDGLLKLEAIDGDTPGEVEVSVTNGAWSLEVEPDVRYRVLGATLGARKTRIENAPILSDSETPVALTASWVTDILLHVVDAETGIELGGVDVLVQKSWGASWVHPTATSLKNALITGAASPVLLEVNSGRSRMSVRAHGYIWADIELDSDQGAEHTVKLSRTASLLVITDVYGIELPVQVRIYPGHWDSPDPAYAEQDIVPGQPNLFESLEPGECQVRVEFGDWRDPPTILARYGVTLAPGKKKTITIMTYTEIPVPPKAALAGTLELPRGANNLGVSLQIRPTHGPGWRASDKQHIPLTRMQLERSWHTETFRWDAGEVSTGKVNLIVHPLQLSVLIDLPPIGDRKVHLAVPEFAHVAVRVVDRSNPERWLKDVQISWSKFLPIARHLLPANPGSVAERSIDPEYLRFDGSGHASFYAPIGHTLVMVGLAGYELDRRWVELVPGSNEVVFALAPRSTLRVGFLYGDDLGPPPTGLIVSAVDGGAEWQIAGPVAGRLLGFVEQPGQYIVRASPEAEYVFNPREVRILAGEQTEVDIAVRPNR